MKSTLWPIHWTYEGDKDAAKKYHGEGRAVLGALKNKTYGGANLGQGSMAKIYENGVLITAEILPGIDKVNIYVPPPELKKEEKPDDYEPYLWVGCRISSGGEATYSEYVEPNNIFNSYHYQPIMTIWEPPQDDKQGQGWSHLDPNETQCVSSERHGTLPIYFAFGTACEYPLQFDRYWQSDELKNQFISYGKPLGIGFVTRCTVVPYATRRYADGPGIFQEDMCYQMTDDGLMSAWWINPYDPEYDWDDPDDDNIWWSTMWCDPLVKRYSWENGMHPIKTAKGILPSGPGPGNIDESVEEAESTGYGYYDMFPDDVPDINGRIIPGKYIVKISLASAEHCPGHHGLPVVVDVEGRVGKKGLGRTAKLRHTITLNPSAAESTYACNHIPYGWWYYQHKRTGETDHLGYTIDDGWGPCPHPVGIWWQGAMIIDAFTGSIQVVDHFDFGGTSEYNFHNYTWSEGDCYDDPFGSSPTYSIPCPSMPCGEVPCAVRTTKALDIVGYASFDGANTTEFSHWVTTGSFGPFEYGFTYADYLVGRYAYVQCTWSDSTEFPHWTEVFITDLFAHWVVICDEEYPTYNGERWWSWTLSQFGGEGDFAGPVSVGSKVCVVIPDTGHLRIALVEKTPNILLLRKFGCAEFDQKYDPPEGY